MPEKKKSRRRFPDLRPLISLAPRAAQIGSATRLLHCCVCCGAQLAVHFEQRNRWIGCRKAGVR